MTREKILDTAERLIAAQGFAGTSVRQIIAEAGVNLAAVHYHFGSKEELLDQLIVRKVTAVNQEREELLRKFESEAGSKAVSVEEILRAFFEPMIETGSRNPQFVKLMGRIIGEGLIQNVAEKHFHQTTMRFAAALRKSLPNLPEAELSWRMQFLFGAMSQAVCVWDVLPPEASRREREPDFRLTIRRLMTFLIAGMKAPATKEVQ